MYKIPIAFKEKTKKMVDLLEKFKMIRRCKNNNNLDHVAPIMTVIKDEWRLKIMY